VALVQEGHPVNRKRVQRYMREMGIWGVAPGPHLSARGPESAVFPYLLGGLEIVRPNQVWGIDLTYIRLRGGWLYLVAVLDWYSRYVLAWELDQTLAIDFVLAAMGRALEQAAPEICNSDQGSQFTSPQWGALLQQAGVRVSMNGKGRALDNCFVERLWRSVKYEEVYLHDYASPREARRGLARYFDFYISGKRSQERAWSFVPWRVTSPGRGCDRMCRRPRKMRWLGLRRCLLAIPYMLR